MFETLSAKCTEILRGFRGKTRISEKNVQDAVDAIKLALLDADVNVRVVRRFVSRTLREASGEAVLRSVAPGQQFVKIVNDKLVEFLGERTEHLALRGPDTVSTIVLAGLQGSGKTTTAAKLARVLAAEGRRVLLVAADLARPAATEQLQQLAATIGVEVATAGTTPLERATRGVERAKREQYDVVIVDTAGRTQLDRALMDEVQQIARKTDAVERLFVADAMTGQHAVEVAKAFHESVDINGVVLTKFDSDTRGGVALSVKTVVGAPIRFIGTGEKLEALEVFHPERIATRMLGMGDVVTLVERAQRTIDADEAAELQRKMQSAAFTLADYLDQFRRMRKIGSLSSMLDMMPGMKQALKDESEAERQMRREEAIILSMTLGERGNHRIIGASRRARIARGSGSSVFEVGQFLKRFEKTRMMMKKMTKNKTMQAQMLAQMSQRS